ncbi:copper chaperone PCu(A)C [uncultured Thermanaerothrix sp.]|uniref:copper chaperone PCu(A)C n=1 Tax=uncultured Thermanaerothrix sp. TaxID=1195149 RepID=UPI0026309253|nr:copper chaperone PCu(A)C [uncultured Thermanaerothrix sp.]
MKRWIWIAGLGIVLLASGLVYYFRSTPSQPLIRIEGAWARASLAESPTTMEHSGTPSHSGHSPADTTATSAAYMTIHNLGRSADYLTEVSAEVANRAEIHQTIMNGDVMQMQPISRLEIPAQSTVQLMPGGYHIMLIGLNHTLHPGDKVRLRLEFEKSGEIEVTAIVR